MSKIALILLLILFIFCNKKQYSNENQPTHKNIDTLNMSSFEKNRPEDIVDIYCKDDYIGKRLEGHSNELTTWVVEPGWDNLIIVKNYNVINCAIKKDTALVKVKYIILGSFDGDKINKIQQNGIEEVVFSLIKTPNGWKIESPKLVPHVSLSAIKIVLMDLLKNEEKESKRVDILKSNILEIDKWSSQINAIKEK